MAKTQKKTASSKKVKAAAKAASVKRPPAKSSAKAKSSAAAKKSVSSSVVKFPRPVLASTSFSSSSERLSPRVQAMIDKSEITEILTSLMRGLDRIDENLLRSVLHHDATVDLGPGVFQGTGNDYIHWILGVLHGFRSSHHMIANVRIELEGDTALVESYFNAQIRIEKPVGREDVFLGGRNLDRFERRPSGVSGVWKIVHRKQILDWARTEAVSDIFYHQNPDALWVSRTKTDPSYHMAQFPGTQNDRKLPAFLGRHYESKSVKF